MRIDPSVRNDANTVQVPNGDKAALELRAGDSLTVRVLASENGNVRLRTQDGAAFTARFEGGIAPNPGEVAELFVSEIRDGVIYMSPEPLPAGGGYNTNLAHLMSDRTLLSYAQQLQSMNLPVNAETLTAMRELLVANPALTPEEAAFLAGNRMSADAETLAALPGFLHDADRAQGLLKLFETIASQLSGVAQNAPDAADSPLTAFLRALPSVLNAANTQTAAAPQTAAAEIAAQSAPVSPETATSQSAPVNLETAAAQSALPLSETAAVPPNPAQNLTQSGVNEYTGAPGNSAQSNAVTAQTGAVTNTILSGAESGALPELTRAANAADALANALSQLPEMRSVPPKRILDFAGVLLRVSQDAETLVTRDGSPIPPVKIVAFVEKLFPEISVRAQRVGQTLKSAREELPTRLALLEETVARMNTQGRSDAIDKTREIRQNERLWNNMEQYVYAQIPVTIKGERTNAELYVYKRRRDRKAIDPQDVNILLAIDLPVLGHTESLVGVRGNNVSLRMNVETPKIKKFFLEFVPKLHTMLDSIGYRLDNADISCEDINVSPANALFTLDESRFAQKLDVLV